MGIRGRLLLLVVGVAVPLALAGAAALRGAWDASRRQLDDSVRQQAELAAVAFERWVDAQRQPLTPVRGGGAVVARVDGAAVSEIFQDITLPERAAIAVLDSEHHLLYRRPATSAAVDPTVDSSPFFAELRDRRAAVFELESPYDGVRRVYGVARAGATDCVAVLGVPSAVLYKPARRQQNRHLLFSLLALACAVVAALFVERGLVHPVMRLREAARELGAGDLAARAPARGGEIGELGASFNLMAERIAEREERLKGLDRLKSEFVSGVSHELRTPLTTIKTLTRLLQRGGQGEEERREYLETIAAECDRQIDLVLNLLDLSRIEAGAFKVSRTPTDVAEVVRACLRIEGHAAEARGQTLAAELPADDLPLVLTDAGALRRVLCGLVENAIKYTPEGGRVTLGARRRAEDGEVAITVTDTGVGILPEDAPLVFEKFFRGRPAAADSASAAESAGYAEAPGVGLGLYLARSIVEQLGGRIEVAPSASSGTVFTVYLPPWREGDEDGAEAGLEVERESEAFASS
ncbi:MAG: HAMP domain-containing protein [Acidobacteria bacterium]|nr:HAMP domain-containing protein [Acidobacteriota bacterium]